MRYAYLATGLLAGFAVAGAAQATTPFLVTYEPESPGQTTSTTTAAFKIAGVENFETASNLVAGQEVSTPIAATGSKSTTGFTTGTVFSKSAAEYAL